MTRIAVLSVSAGAGHMRAAEALVAAAEARYPQAEVVLLDVMDLVAGYFKKVYADGYVRLVQRHPQMWGYVYRKTDRYASDSGFNRFWKGVERFCARHLKTWLRRFDPDHVICTHFLPAQYLSKLVTRGTWDRPVWVCVTDFDCHALWLHPGMTGYFVASEEVAWRMRDRGVDARRIQVTGIPVLEVFGRKLDREVCARELGIDADRFTVLLLSGGHGITDIETAARRLLQLPHNFQIVALAGTNQKRLRALQALADRHPDRLTPMGFTRTIQRVMACADLAVSKPGGLTTSECMAMGLPLVTVSPIPGQEERNADYLIECGAALKAYDESTLAYRVNMLIEDPVRLQRMASSARAMGSPEAARRVLEQLI